MMTRFVEHLLISLFNRAADRREQPALAPTPPPSPSLPDDWAVVGHQIGDEVPPPLVALSPQERLRHLYLLGATGTGKTNLLLRLIESDIAQGRSLCVVDLRGDLIDRVLLRLAVAAPPQYLAERLLFLDLRDDRYVVGFNPLQGEGDIYNRALHVLAVIKTQSESWGVQLEETLRNCLLALASSGWTLLEIEPLLTNRSFRVQVMAHVEDARVRSFFERFNSFSPAQQTTWTLAVLNKVSPLISLPTLRRVFGQRQALPLRAMLDGAPGQVILVSLSVDRLHEAARLAGGLFVSTFQSAIMARSDRPEAARIPVNLYVDEFETMASDRFESIVAEGRRFGLGLTLCHQNNHQLGTGLRHVLRNNVHSQFYFQTGALDAAELAPEIGGGETREQVRETLMSQGVGQAFLVRRGQPSVRVRVLPCPDPSATRDQVEAIKRAAQSRFSQPVGEIDRELCEREARCNPRSSSPRPPRNSSHSAPSQTPDPASPAATESATANENAAVPDQTNAPRPTYEIRHEKLDRFRASDDTQED